MNKLVPLIALAATALVGLDLMVRPQKHVDGSADRVARGRGIPLEALSHRLLPQLENARAYRLIGLLIIVVAAVLAAMVVAR